jgi:hypothetical protein
VPAHPQIAVDAHGRVSMTSRRRRAWALQLRAGTECHIENDIDVFEEVRHRLLAGEWEIDDFVVTQRTRAREGFALVGCEKGFVLELDVGSGLKLVGQNELAQASLATQLATREGSGSFHPFANPPDSSRIPTPSFSAPIGVNQALWGKLVPIGDERGLRVINAAGRVLKAPPINLKDRGRPERVYRPGLSGAMTPDEIMALPLWELFRPLSEIGWRQTTRQVLTSLNDAVTNTHGNVPV